MSLWNLLPSSGVDRAPRGNPALLPADRLHRVLLRERLRADRSGSPFCLLAIAAEENWTPDALDRLAKIFESRLRITDDPGLLADGRVGVVLPETPGKGAWKLVDDLRKLFAGTLPVARFQVYEYPAYTQGNGQSSSQMGVDGEQITLPMDEFFRQPLPGWKRALDIVGAAALAVATSPFMLLAVVAVKLSSPGPVLFSQLRDGLGGRPFTIYKFRTMRVGADAEKALLRAHSEQDGPAFKLRKDPRVTWLGGWLRKTSIDELPQLWNVLLGEMSLVGPRPLPCDESAECENWQKRRLDITPGLTCIWQVKGRSRVSFAEWIRMDLAYARARSWWTDVKLLVSTVPAVLLRRGAK